MHLLLGQHQLWVSVIGALVPLVTYVLNHYAPWVSEPVKAGVLVVVTAIASGLYTALATPNFGLNLITLQLVVSSVVAALLAHHWLWKPSTISTKLGAGSDAPPRQR
jgi:hypothetical protein